MMMMMMMMMMISKENMMSIACDMYGREVVFLGKSERERAPGKPSHRWEVNINLDNEEIGEIS